VLVPDYAPLTPGHLLLLARPHALSTADHLQISPLAGAQLVELFDEYLRRYDHLTIIEHGSTPAVERDAPCIAHAHLHLLPLEVSDVRAVFRNDVSPSHQHIPWADLPNVASGLEYVLVGGRDDFDIALEWHPATRQYARSLVTRTIDLPLSQAYSDTCVLPELVEATLAEWR
jgi:hypothetical protein